MSKWMIQILILMSVVGFVAAQTDSCETLLRAIETIGENCAEITRNQVCYANHRVDARFYEELEDSFSDVSDVVDILKLESLSTSASSIEEWGVAVLNVQANLPYTLPGQSVIVIMMGETNARNAVEAEYAFVSNIVVPVETVVRSSNLRSAPSSDSHVIGTVPFGTVLEADAKSSDSAWLRVVSDFGPAWISVSLIEPDGRLNELPIYSASSRSPMQAFSLSTGIGQASCAELPPSGALIQVPKDVIVPFDINGIEFLAEASFFIQIVERQYLQLITIDGSVRSDNVVLPPGFTAFRQLNADGTAPAGPWQNVRPLSSDELAQITHLEIFNQSFFNYPVDVPSAEEIAQSFSAINQDTPPRAGGDTWQEDILIVAVEVQIIVSSPAQIDLVVLGGVDGCDLPVITEQRREGNVVTVHMYREKPIDMACPMNLVPYEETIRLNGSFEGGTIEIHVNDFVTWVVLAHAD
jgi:hypothetical protein